MLKINQTIPQMQETYAKWGAEKARHEFSLNWITLRLKMNGHQLTLVEQDQLLDIQVEILNCKVEMHKLEGMLRQVYAEA